MAVIVMVIECVGMIGAGKSTIARALNDLLVEHGWTVLTPREAITRCCERSLAGRLGARVVAKRWYRLALKASVRLVSMWFGMLFALRHWRLVWQVCAAQRHRPIPWWHRRLIVRLFFDAASAHHFLQRRLAPGEAVIFEEGLVHRAINMYAWEPAQLDHGEVLRYFRRLPRSDLLVFVHAPYEVCVARAEARGLPLRLRDKDPLTVQRFMQHAQQIIDLASHVAASGDRAVLGIHNGGALEDAVRALRSQLHAQENRRAGSQQYESINQQGSR